MSTAVEETSKWKSTDLWHEIEKRQGGEAESIKALLTSCMPDIETLLSSAGTSPPDFTLHDAGHSYRVAQKMARIVPVDVFGKLSVYELALLLLSAYLHDIGMTPERKLVSSHYEYLLTGKPEGLSPNEVEQLQAWLDDEADGIAPPIAPNPLTADALRTALELTARYCRAKHGDWGEKWIRENEASLSKGSYPAWIDDLVTLCRSHLQGYDELGGERFDPRPVGGSAEIVHLRYLATVLRIADVLEFDPERTPAVVFKRRDVTRESAVYWWKDHEISLKIEDARVLVSARPRNAQVHRAVELTADEIERELGLCRRLAETKHFDKCPGLTRPLPHRWDLQSYVYRDVRPRDESYEYIDGSFRPDTGKLLQILSGNQLYGNRFAAIRELLQNAFDAVREQIAYERLRQDNPSDEALGATFANIHIVDLRVNLSDEGLVLACKDDGIGMTKAIIRDHLLVSGSARRHDILALERHCAERGFRLGRTGRFGIGVLSYFMLAKRVIITTRRSQEAGDAESTGWRFETEGVGSFGALGKVLDIDRGTSVALQLREEVVGLDPAAFYSALCEYLKRILVRIPCRFVLSAGIPGCQPLSLQAGWTLEDSERLLLAASRVREEWKRPHDKTGTPLELMSNAQRAQLEASERDWHETVEELESSARFEELEGEIPGARGHYRLHMLHFDLAGGPSLRFLRARHGREETSALRLKNVLFGYAVSPWLTPRTAWNGMAASVRSREERSQLGYVSGFLLEIDLESPKLGSVSVNRASVSLSPEGEEAIRWVLKEGRGFRHAFAAGNRDSAFSWLNARTVGLKELPDRNINWLLPAQGQERRASWGRVAFPAISALALAYNREALYYAPMTLGREPVAMTWCLGGPHQTDPYTGQAWYSSDMSPDRIVPVGSRGGRATALSLTSSVVPVWLNPPTAGRRVDFAGLASEFPPTWDGIIGIEFENFSSLGHGATVWNPAHPLLRVASQKAWEWCQDVFARSLDPLPAKKDLLREPARAACWILVCLLRGQKQLWEGLRDRDPAFLEEVWRLALPPAKGNHETWPEPVHQLLDSGVGLRLRTLKPTAWATKRISLRATCPELKRPLADVPPEWLLVVDLKEAGKY